MTDDTARMDDARRQLPLWGRSQAFRSCLLDIERVAEHDVSVLLEGETGTGKEVCAKALHYLSRRRDRPFISVNCAALPIELAESEFFGHRRGAFTHAVDERTGLIMKADGGTLLLDEVGSMDARLQAKLLRFLQDGECRPVGSDRPRSADVRVVAASNMELREMVEGGRFRSDLYFRLAAYRIRVPPLRERPSDVPVLARGFLCRHAERLGLPEPELASDVEAALVVHPWPGNARELENVIQQVLLRCARGDTVRLEHLPPEIAAPELTGRPTASPDGEFKALKQQVISTFERQYLERLLRRHGGNVTRAAEAAGLHRRGLTDLMRKHRLDRSSYLS